MAFGHPSISTGRLTAANHPTAIHNLQTTSVTQFKTQRGVRNHFDTSVHYFTHSLLIEIYPSATTTASAQKMPRRRVKIEFTDDEGSKYTISLEGLASKDKLSRIMEIINELDANGTDATKQLTLNTTFNKILKIIEDKFALGTFTSSDILEAYEDTYNSPTKLSTVSTYLTRLYDRGHVKREQIGSVWAYRKNKMITTR